MECVQEQAVEDNETYSKGSNRRLVVTVTEQLRILHSSLNLTDQPKGMGWT
jgi:hypothetical protein